MFPRRLGGGDVAAAVVAAVGRLVGQYAVAEGGAALKDQTHVTPLAEAVDNVLAV